MTKRILPVALAACIMTVFLIVVPTARRQSNAVWPGHWVNKGIGNGVMLFLYGKRWTKF
jgi:hypothetical protein